MRYDLRSIWLQRPDRLACDMTRYGVTAERDLAGEGAETWAIRCGYDVMDHQGRWRWEPLPDFRDDAFLHACRFPTLRAAVKTYRRAAKED